MLAGATKVDIGTRGLRMNRHLPEVITLRAECSTHLGYDNHPVATVNDHVVRIATMTEPYQSPQAKGALVRQRIQHARALRRTVSSLLGATPEDACAHPLQCDEPRPSELPHRRWPEERGESQFLLSNSKLTRALLATWDALKQQPPKR